MPKAILELEMPESCDFCKLLSCSLDDIFVCAFTGNEVPVLRNERAADCPLKLVDKDILEKQTAKKVIETPDKHKYGYCPVCGRIYWDKSHVGNYCDQCGQRLEVEP